MKKETLIRIEAKLDLLLEERGLVIENINRSVGGGGIKKPRDKEDDIDG